jgi:hypothetical protein
VRKVENVLHAVVAFAFGAGLLVAVVKPAKADAAADWVEFRVASGLPVDPKPSLPGELPVGGGPVADALPEPLPAVNGNGNGNGHAKLCDDPFVVELARSDGDVRGEDARCN